MAEIVNHHPIANRRKFVRHQIELPCRYSHGAMIITGTVIDLSSGGCRMSSAIGPPTGTAYLAVDIHCFIDAHALSIELAVVRWTRDAAFGMEFIRMTPLQQTRLRHLVAFIEAGHQLGLEPQAGC